MDDFEIYLHGQMKEPAFREEWEKSEADNRILFVIGRDVPNAETRKTMEDAGKGIGLSRPFSSVKELMEDLNADDVSKKRYTDTEKALREAEQLAHDPSVKRYTDVEEALRALKE